MLRKLGDFLIEFPLAAFGVLLLILVILVRPHEFMSILEGVPLLNGVFALTIVGLVVETALGRIRNFWSPQLPFVAMFLAWTYVASLKNDGMPALKNVTIDLAFSVLYFVVVCYGMRSLGRFKAIAATLLGCAIFFSAVGIHQSRQEFECVELERDEITGESDPQVGFPKGKECSGVSDCEKNFLHSKVEWECEKYGLFDAFTVAHGRIRWRGRLADPNELTLFTCSVLAFAFAFHSEGRGKLRNVLLLATVAVIGYGVILSQSRGGILVFGASVGAYFIKKYGARGVITGGFLASPIVFLGGREDQEGSSQERLGLLYDGFDLVRESPLFGVGQGQFKEHVFPPLTAHNAYLLSCAELGFPGLFLFTWLLYTTVKIPVVLSFAPPPGLDPGFRTWGTALMVLFVGTCLGIFFLSFTYHPLLFIFFGLSGALYGAAKQANPTFKVSISAKELAIVSMLAVGLIGVIGVYTRIKGAP
ncbi:MAG: O-antigen ligase family protein [Polyangiaceae bacterium]